MSTLIDRLGIQSYCFRKFPETAGLLRLLQECGVSHTEICRIHADFSDPSCFERVLTSCRDAGMQIDSIGVNGIFEDPEAHRSTFDFAKQAGCRFMSIDFKADSSPDSWRVAEALAEEYDMQLGIHNHGARHWLGSIAMIEHVLSRTSERIGLCLDTAWALDCHQDPVAMAEKFRDRLYGIHIKDFVFDRSGQYEDVVVGQGNLDLPALMKLLTETAYEAPLILEYEGDALDPVPKLRECVEAVRQACG